MTTTRMKSSIYLSSHLHERVKALSKATQLPINTHVVLALESYLKQEQHVELINSMGRQDEHTGTKPFTF